MFSLGASDTNYQHRATHVPPSVPEHGPQIPCVGHSVLYIPSETTTTIDHRLREVADLGGRPGPATRMSLLRVT